MRIFFTPESNVCRCRIVILSSHGTLNILFLRPKWLSLRCRCDNSSVGRALASQAEGRGFEPRLSLRSRRDAVSIPFFICNATKHAKKNARPIIIGRAQKKYQFCLICNTYSTVKEVPIFTYLSSVKDTVYVPAATSPFKVRTPSE